MKKKKRDRKIIHMNKRKDTTQTETIFSENFEKQFNEWDKEMFLLASNFRENMWGIKKTFVDIHSSAIEELKILNQINENEVSSKTKLKQKDLNRLTKGIIDNRNRQTNDLELSLEIKIKEDEIKKSIFIIEESLYVLLFSRYEANLEKLYGIYSTKYPGSINYKHKFSTKDLKEYSTISAAELFVQEETIRHQMRKSRKDQLIWMKEQKIEFELDDNDSKLFDMYYSFRNCIVHSDSILRDEDVDFAKDFMKQSQSYSGKDLDKVISKGKKLNLDWDVFFSTLQFLCYVGNLMIVAFWQKFGKGDTAFRLISQIYMGYIITGEYDICRNIYSNLLNSKLERNNLDEVYSILCYCVSLKLVNSDSYLKKLNEIDWTDLSDEVLILKNGILDDVEGVIKCMRSIGRNGSIKIYFDEVPLKFFLKWGFFDGVRDDPKYLKAYKKNF